MMPPPPPHFIHPANRPSALFSCSQGSRRFAGAVPAVIAAIEPDVLPVVVAGPKLKDTRDLTPTI